MCADSGADAFLLQIVPHSDPTATTTTKKQIHTIAWAFFFSTTSRCYTNKYITFIKTYFFHSFLLLYGIFLKNRSVSFTNFFSASFLVAYCFSFLSKCLPSTELYASELNGFFTFFLWLWNMYINAVHVKVMWKITIVKLLSIFMMKRTRRRIKSIFNQPILIYWFYWRKLEHNKRNMNSI